MASLNLEFAFTVPKNVVYEALINPMYAPNNSGKSCSTPEHKQQSNPKKEENMLSWMAKSKAAF